MNFTGRRPRRRLIVWATPVAALTLLVGIGAMALLRSDNSPTTTANLTSNTVEDLSAPEVTSRFPATGSDMVGPYQVRASSDPETFARQVAETLFAWDTATGHDPTDFGQRIVDLGDPAGIDNAGLASDVRSYLPTTKAWGQLRQFQTRQWLTITTVGVPAGWADALAQAAPGQLLPGTTAYTITGIRHRDGIWGTDPVDAARPVAFTVFITCAPTFETCRLLRLSGLDNPLH